MPMEEQILELLKELGGDSLTVVAWYLFTKLVFEFIVISTIIVGCGYFINRLINYGVEVSK
jgi:hypothetical protein